MLRIGIFILPFLIVSFTLNASHRTSPGLSELGRLTMPVKVINLSGGIGNRIVCTGYLEGEEFITALNAHLTQDEADFQKYRYSIVDLMDCDFDITLEQIQHIIQMVRIAYLINPEPVVAIISNTDLKYGFARMFEQMSGNHAWETKVFRANNEAEFWIRERANQLFGLSGFVVNDNAAESRYISNDYSD